MKKNELETISYICPKCRSIEKIYINPETANISVMIACHKCYTIMYREYDIKNSNEWLKTIEVK